MIPIGLVCWWLLKWHKHTWQRAIWELCGPDIEQVARQVGGNISVRGAGWCVIFADKTGYVIWSPGLISPQTRIRVLPDSQRRTRESIPGLAPAHWVLGQLQDRLGRDLTDLE